MSLLFLLDSNVVSDVVRAPAGAIAQRIEKVGEEHVGISIIAAAELRYGIARKVSARLRRNVDGVLKRLRVVPLDPPADYIYGELRAELARRGELIGPNDLLIAAHALALDCTLVTDHEREFSRVGGLRIENWLRG